MLPHNGIVIFMVAYPLFSGSGTVNYSRDIHFLLFLQYLDITYYSDPACFSAFYQSSVTLTLVVNF